MSQRQGQVLSAFGARLAGWVASASGLVCALALAAIAVLITVGVVSRSFFGYAFQSFGEISGYLVVAVTFLGLCVAIYENALFRVEALIDRLPARGRWLLDLLSSAMFIAFLAILDYHCVMLVVDSYAGGYVAATLLGTPLYIPQLLMPIGLTAAIVVLVVRFLQSLAGPAAVPDAEEEGRS